MAARFFIPVCYYVKSRNDKMRNREMCICSYFGHYEKSRNEKIRNKKICVFLQRE